MMIDNHDSVLQLKIERNFRPQSNHHLKNSKEMTFQYILQNQNKKHWSNFFCYNVALKRILKNSKLKTWNEKHTKCKTNLVKLFGGVVDQNIFKNMQPMHVLKFSSVEIFSRLIADKNPSNKNVWIYKIKNFHNYTFWIDFPYFSVQKGTSFFEFHYWNISWDKIDFLKKVNPTSDP